MAGSKLWGLFNTVSSIGAGIGARKVLTKGWRATTGQPPPSNPAHPDATFAEAAAFAMATGAMVGLARMLATRRAASYWRRSTGALPPGMVEDDAV